MFEDEMGQVVAEQMQQADALLLGRETYKEFAAHWPYQDPTLACARTAAAGRAGFPLVYRQVVRGNESSSRQPFCIF
ncbi:hypothetical protein [Nonomuraea sp. NPDC003804]|uniref:hypothetical protein n=1 Tax=Nonomuraea sp. NPDC003804 TaxID=3154547 RepID=UPI0033BA37CE